MLARIRRSGSVLAIVAAAYTVYAWVVVPLVEPSVRLAAGKRPKAPAAAQANQRDPYFPEGAWELDRRTKRVETEQGTLYFADYKPLPDGRMELTKCTVIAHFVEPSSKSSDPSAKPEERRPIIIQAPHGATLNFDQQLNVLRGEFGRLVGGQLAGEVTIQSPASGPDRDDALQLVTKNVQIDPQKIWTPHEVRFRYGPNAGSGRVLTIHLAGEKASAGAQAGLGIKGVRLLELLHLDQMKLLLDDRGLFGRNQVRIADANAKSLNVPTTLDVKCRGPLRFDVVQQLMSLEDQVDLIRQHPGGAKDQLQCQLLQIYFSNSAKRATLQQPVQPAGTPAPPADTQVELGKLTPTRVVATGHPVIIRAAAVGMGARAERIEYDCILQRVWLQDRNKVMLNDRQREIEAVELQYTLGEENRLGEWWARGPGQVRGTFGQEARRFDVSWKEEVQMRRIDNEPVLSFRAGAQVAVADFGHFTGEILHLYLREVPREGTKDRIDILPDRLHAVGNVQVETESGHAALREAKIWFRPPDPDRPVSRPADGTAPIAGLLAPSSGPTSERRRSKYDLRAEVVEAVVQMGDTPAADLLIVRGGLELRERVSGEVLPVEIRGDHFELQEGASEHPRAALLGSPAEFHGRGAAARGPKLHLHPADNFLEIVGAGDLKLPPRRSDDPAAGESAPMVIEWGGKMQFDGLLARFERDVTVRGTDSSRNGEKSSFVAVGDAVHAELSKPVDFRQADLAGPVELVKAAFDGWGFLQMEMFEPSGERKLFQQMQLNGLVVNQLTGDIRGQGPGWLRGVHRGKELLTNNPNASPVPLTAESGLSFLRVDFEREVTGNLRQKRLEFLNGTRSIYGRVQSWDESLDQQQTNMPGVVRLTCDRLAVAQSGDGGADTVELEAVGNAHIHGDAFQATGDRVSYVRLKDQFILEGDGRNDARIEFHPRPGAQPSHLAAGKILYWPKTRQCQIVDLRPTDLYDLGQLRGRAAPTIKPR